MNRRMININKMIVKTAVKQSQEIPNVIDQKCNLFSAVKKIHS